jgi:hypothetical protein
VATYKVINLFDNLGASRDFIHEKSASLRLDIDLEAMSIREQSDAGTVFEPALDQRSRLNEGAVPIKEDPL